MHEFLLLDDFILDDILIAEIFRNEGKMVIKWRGTYEICPESIQPCTMKNRDIYWTRYKKHCTQDSDASDPFKVGINLT